jgi:hypothetical protein
VAAASAADRETALQFDAGRLKEQRRAFYASLRKRAENHRSPS